MVDNGNEKLLILATLASIDHSRNLRTLDVDVAIVTASRSRLRARQCMHGYHENA